MASWIVHLRIADNIRGHLKNCNEEQFIVGNIAPDCGEVMENGYDYDPPSKITHWTKTGKKRDIDYDSFYDTYIAGNTYKEKMSFYTGYYTHLITDFLWVKMIILKPYNTFFSHIDEKEFGIKLREEAFYLDNLYLKSHVDFYSYSLLKNIEKFPNDFLSYYSYKAIENRIQTICDVYENFEENAEMKFIYISEKAMNDFINNASEIILKILNEKLLTDNENRACISSITL